MTESNAQSRLDSIRNSICDLARNEFDRHYDVIVDSTPLEKQLGKSFQKDALLFSLHNGYKLAQKQIDKVIEGLTTPTTSPDILQSVRNYLETSCLRKLEMYSELYPTLQPKGAPVEKCAECEVRMMEERPKSPKTPEEWTDEVKIAIVAMAEIAKQHVEVYPIPHKPGVLVIPTGRLAKCQCDPDCNVELAEPEYRVIGESELKDRWSIDNRVQKHQKAQKSKKTKITGKK